MKKSALVMLLAVFFALAGAAQSVQEGVNHIYAERNNSAKATFEKILAANPNNLEAIYWLGQAQLELGAVADARITYSRALTTNGNAPLLVAGIGHVLLVEGKSAEARQQFEMALNLSRGKKGDDPAVLNAVGRANVETPSGDVAYGLSKLQAASQLAPANADVHINLGNAYRRAHEGGEAVKAYGVAAANGQRAVALYRMARIYETQRNWDVVTENLNNAIAADPKYGPAYLRQYVYNLFYKQDFTAANEWAQKYVAVAEPSLQNEIFKAQPLYLQKKYSEAIAIGDRIIQQSGNAKIEPTVYRLMAYSYLEGPKDTAKARQYVDQLFATAKKDEFVAKDYSLKAAIYSKEAPNEVVNVYMDAMEGDTTLRNKLLILQEGIDWAKSSGRKVAEADLRLAQYRVNPNSNPASLFQVGLPYYQGGAFAKADSAFQAYSRAFPDSLYGYLWSARALANIDTSGKQGLAVPQYEQVLRVSATDKVRFAPYGYEAATNLANYYVNEKGDRAKGAELLRQAIAFDPSKEPSLKGVIERLEKPAAPARPSRPSGATKVKTENDKTKAKVKK
ncbi:MAG: tetratricopeptide repeat protein [Chitinophagaceae bacterium]|nr:MAG: tetratricopeptide repeat protein [Chitinophagaceae bacterium]